jgi:hypothetical protein
VLAIRSVAAQNQDSHDLDSRSPTSRPFVRLVYVAWSISSYSYAGRMFWLMWKRLFGSYWALILANLT